MESPADSQVVQGYQFFKIFDEHQLEYILLANGGGEDVYMVGKIAVFQIQNLLVAYKERFDKDNFIKNLLLDNLLLVDIYNRAKKLHIDTEVRRVIFIIETNRMVGLRRIDGDELFHLLLAQRRCRGNDIQESLDSGMNDHISKPINMEELIDTITKYIKHD